MIIDWNSRRRKKICASAAAHDFHLLNTFAKVQHSHCGLRIFLNFFSKKSTKSIYIYFFHFFSAAVICGHGHFGQNRFSHVKIRHYIINILYLYIVSQMTHPKMKMTILTLTKWPLILLGDILIFADFIEVFKHDDMVNYAQIVEYTSSWK